MAQTSVVQYGPVGYPGLIGDTAFTDKMSYSAEAQLNFGVPVQLGTNPDRQIKPLTTATGQAANAIGFSIASNSVEQTYQTGLVFYAVGNTVPVMKRGRIWLQTSGAVTAGKAANLKLASGLLTDEAVGAGVESFTNFKATFITSTTAAGLALVEIK